MSYRPIRRATNIDFAMQHGCLHSRPGDVLACTTHVYAGLLHVVPHAPTPLRQLRPSAAGTAVFRRQLSPRQHRQHAGRCRRGPPATSAMFGGLGKLFKGDEGERTRARYQAQLDAINALEPEMQSLSDDQLRERTVSLQQRAQGGATLNELLVEAFAVRYPFTTACALALTLAYTPALSKHIGRVTPLLGLDRTTPNGE